MKIKNLIASVLLGLGLMTSEMEAQNLTNSLSYQPTPKLAQDFGQEAEKKGSSILGKFNPNKPSVTLETFVANDKIVQDTKVCGQITDRIGYFGRNLTTFKYNTRQVGQFSFIDVTYKLSEKFDAVYETQFIDTPQGTLVTPRLGAQSFNVLGKDLTLYTLNTFNVPTERDPKFNGELVATLKWNPPLTKSGNLRGVVQAETVTNYGMDGLNFATQNLRLGLDYKKVSFGLGANLIETKDTFDQSFGAYFGVKF